MQTSLVTPATMSFLRPVAFTAVAKSLVVHGVDDAQALDPGQQIRWAGSDSSSLRSGPCACSSMLEVSTVRIFRILAALGQDQRVALQCHRTEMDLTQPMVPT